MSLWTHIRGTITVWPMGRTQHEMTYILNTVLDHLPFVTGSEENMRVIPMQAPGCNSSSSHNEFGEPYIRERRDMGETQHNYILVLYGDLRDRTFNVTFKEFLKWLCRLAKRVTVEDICVKIEADDKHDGPFVFTDRTPFWNMDEYPSWSRASKEGKPCWAEYLMWEYAKGSNMPLEHMWKYYNDADTDAEMERRQKWRDS